jgi:hypothetical protein
MLTGCEEADEMQESHDLMEAALAAAKGAKE